ncbi:MAG: AAA family ATPase [Calditrichaeota bacterium]|nr:AAA family ATPase [Calditrichota bacterium]
MARIVSFIIQKGGCGKTTTTANTAAYLAMQGFKVLAVDMDPQGNLTQHFGYDTDQLDDTILKLFLNQKSFEEVVLKRSDNLHLLPNNIETAGYELTIYKSLAKEYLLRDVLHPISNAYDFILIDCPPNLGIFSLNALVASTEFILVVSPEFFPMRAIKPFYDTYLMVKKKLNHTLQFKGVLMTMCDFRTRHSQEVRKILEKNFPHKLYKAYIRNNVSLKEASSVGQSIFEYDPQSTGAFDYQNFVEEFIRDYESVQQKRRYYDEKFNQLSEEEKKEILHFARQNLSQYVRHKLDEMENARILQEALIIERNRILEKLFPYRQHAYSSESKS